MEYINRFSPVRWTELRIFPVIKNAKAKKVIQLIL